jgi:hypothetical protein
MEVRFDHDFSRVRVHTDAEAGRFATSIGAAAATLGHNVWFGPGRYQPSTAPGRRLLAHELAHVVQAGDAPAEPAWVAPASDPAEAEASRVADAVVQGGPVPRPARQPARLFREALVKGGDYDLKTLQAYLQGIDKAGRIEDRHDSDDKAREIVAAWKSGRGGFTLTPRLKVLLVKEMQSGFTGDDDERAILDILERTPNSEMSEMWGPGKLDANDVLSDFHGDEEDRLLRFFDQRFEGGSKAVLRGSLKLKPRAELFGKEQVEVTSAADAKEVRRIIQKIHDLYGVDLDSDQGVAAVKERYADVPAAVLAGVKKRVWHLDELQALERALAHYGPIMGTARATSTRTSAGQEVTTAGKVEQSIDQHGPAGVLDTTTMGEYFGARTNFSLFKAAEGKSGDFPGDVPKQLEGTTVHEIAHGVLKYRLPRFVSSFQYWKDENTRDANPTTRIANKKGIEAPITRYGTTNAGEDLAETAMFFFVQPATLKSGIANKVTATVPPQGTPGNPCPRRFAFMEQTVKEWTPKPKPPGKGKKP